MPASEHPPAASHYAGLRLTVTQHPDKPVCLVSLATKRVQSPWDEWSLIFPTLRVPVRDVASYEDILMTAVAAIQALLRSDQEHR